MCRALLDTTHSIHVSCDWARRLAERGANGDRSTALALLRDARADAARVQAPGLIQKCEALHAQIAG